MRTVKRNSYNKNCINISGEQLCHILENALKIVKDAVNSNSFVLSPELSFTYKNKFHYAGVHYDRKQAKREKRTKFDITLSDIFIDQTEYMSIDDVYKNARIDGKKLNTILNGILIDPVFKDLL